MTKENKTSNLKEVIKFTREKEFRFQKSLGRGGVGKTILIKDDTLGESFVCKKYLPFYPEDKEKYYKNFIDEIKILYQINHPNIVRVFNYYLYPEKTTGYILMEYIDGRDVVSYIRSNPMQINDIFSQVIKGFVYLESKGLLHRDIRVSNLMVSNDGKVKIIDFGFGKNINNVSCSKSISLNWPYPCPEEFNENKYDFKTEVYFVGCLFKELIDEKPLLNEFDYGNILERMIKKTYAERISSFEETLSEIENVKFKSYPFTEKDKQIYIDFAEGLMSICSSFEGSIYYKEDLDQITEDLNFFLRNSSLEKYVQANNNLIRCFVASSFHYKQTSILLVEQVKNFRDWWVGLSLEDRKIVLNSLWNRFNKIPVEDDDLPF